MWRMLIVLVFLGLCVHTAAALDGSGTQEDPLRIQSLADFDEFATYPFYWSFHTRLEIDVNLAGRTYTTAVIAPDIIDSDGFQGIGFTGVFDGNAHKIICPTIYGWDYSGLFGFIKEGEVKNLGIEGVSVIGRYLVGGLIGYIENGNISNCYSTADVSGDCNYVGCLVGYNYTGTITNCYSTGSVTGTDYVGGLVGDNYGTISKCYSTGSITGTGSYIGGLVGSSSGPVTVCFWDIQTSGLATSAGGTGLTTAQMQTESTFFCWSADSVWTIDEGKDYPRLWWENAPGHYITRDYYYGGGRGTQADPYLIYTAEQLNMIGLIKCDLDRHFKLMADIDLSGYDGKDGRPSFNIINSFTGVFDGNDHKIIGLSIDAGGNDFLGLFGCIEGGEVKNLGLEGISVSGRYFVGGLVAMNSGTVSNCYSTGTVNVTGDFVGGLVGENGGTISNCYSAARVLGSQIVGGLVGANCGNVINCYSTGAVSGYREIGGLLGGNSDQTMVGPMPGYVYNSYSTGDVSGNDYVGGLVAVNSGTVSNCYSTGSVNGTKFSAGGLVGENYDYGRLTNCYSTGNVDANGYVGGLAGRNFHATIVNCYSIGSVDGNNLVGGLVGENWASSISNCYSTGDVNGVGCVGGLVGYNEFGDIESSFWDVETIGEPNMCGGQLYGSGCDPNCGKTTTEMKTISTFTDAGWDFIEIWGIGENQTYPYLLTGPAGDFNYDKEVNFIDLAILAEHWLEEK